MAIDAITATIFAYYARGVAENKGEKQQTKVRTLLSVEFTPHLWSNAGARRTWLLLVSDQVRVSMCRSDQTTPTATRIRRFALDNDCTPRL